LATQFLSLSDQELLAQCDMHTYKSSGPGGQHRNKVSSAVRLRHRETGVTAHGDDSRSQHQNKAMALKRLRMNMALRLRSPLPDASLPDGGQVQAGETSATRRTIPPVVMECMFIARGGDAKGNQRLEIGSKDHRFWQVAAFVLDVLEAHGGQLAAVASYIGITTGNLSRMIESERHLFAAGQDIRKAHGLKPLS
jgi:hypothetical protein